MNKESWTQLKSKFSGGNFHLPTILVFSFDALLIFAGWKVSFYSNVGFILGILSWSLAFIHLYLHLHEATHSAISDSSYINDFIGHLCGWIVLMPYLPRQTSHLLHHTWTGHPERDPANKRMIGRFTVITQPEVKRLEFLWKYWIPIIIVNDRIGLWRAPHQQWASGIKSLRVKRELISNFIYFFSYVVTVILFFNSSLLFHFSTLYVTSIIVCFVIEELANLPHHAETPLLSIDSKALPYWEQYKVTHSCKSVDIWSHFILLNFNLHVAHHLVPNAPWYRLPEIQREVEVNYSYMLNEHETTNELKWSLSNRKRPLLDLMGHYFDKMSWQQNELKKS